MFQLSERGFHVDPDIDFVKLVINFDSGYEL